MHHIIEATTTSGTLLVNDPVTREALSEELRYWLGVFTDVHGKTELAGDFREPWDAVRNRAVRKLAAGIPGSVCALQTAPGRFTIRVRDEPRAPDLRSHGSETFVSVTSGFIDVNDPFGEGDGIARTAPIPCASGEYEVRVHAVETAYAPQTVGVIGNIDHPALVLELAPVEWRASSISLVERTHESWPTAPAPGRLCRATVHKLDGNVAILKLRITDCIYSGYGRLRLLPSEELLPQSDLVVRLREYSGAFWWCDFADSHN